MTGPLSSLSLTTVRSMRLTTFAEIETATKNLIEKEDLLKKSLREVAPTSVAQFLEDEGTIDDLFKFGQSSRKIVYQSNSYGFKKAMQVKQAFLALKEAWQDAVEIEFYDGESHRIEVALKIP